MDATEPTALPAHRDPRPPVLLAGRWDPGERDEWLAALQPALPEVRWVLDAPGADAEHIELAVVANPPHGALAGLPRLALIQSLWAGVDKLLADPTLPPQVPIARMVDPAMNAAMAQTALWAVLTLHRGFQRYAQAQRQGRWAPHAQRRADEVAVTVLGMGQMGRATVTRLREVGYDVHGWALRPAVHAADPSPVPVEAGAAALPALLARSEIVVNLLPLTDATRGLIDARFLAQLPPDAALVNLARGAHVVEADLLAALDSDRLAHAVLDVFQTEPLPAGHAFWSHPRVTLLPHAAAMTDARSAAAVVAHNLRAHLDGGGGGGGTIAHRVDRVRGY
jgi:glyoxylate/hydroxypyruvate reductase A